MKYDFLKIKNYIEEINIYDTQENFEYDHFPFIHSVLSVFSVKEQDDFVENLFTWSEYDLYIISYFLYSTNFKLKGKYNSGYVYCECFSKINELNYLQYLAGDLEIQLVFCNNKNSLSVNEIVSNLYLVIQNTKDVNLIDNYLKIIESFTI